MIISVEESVECLLVRISEFLGDNLHHFSFIHKKYHMTWFGLELGPL
jgi:hypothetical protein